MTTIVAVTIRTVIVCVFKTDVEGGGTYGVGVGEGVTVGREVGVAVGVSVGVTVGNVVGVNIDVGKEVVLVLVLVGVGEVVSTNRPGVGLSIDVIRKT